VRSLTCGRAYEDYPIEMDQWKIPVEVDQAEIWAVGSRVVAGSGRCSIEVEIRFRILSVH
jgi:hypothetical protein